VAVRDFVTEPIARARGDRHGREHRVLLGRGREDGPTTGLLLRLPFAVRFYGS